MQALALLLLSLAVCGCTWTAAAADIVTASSFASDAGTFRLSWHISSSSQRIYFSMSGKTTGWVGMGLSTSPRMAGADIVAGWVMKGGAVRVVDQYGVGDVEPVNDVVLGGSFDLYEIVGFEANGWTTINYSRPLDSGDSKDFAIRGGPVYLLYALGALDGNKSVTNASMTGIYAMHSVSASATITLTAAADDTTILFDPGLIVLMSMAILVTAYALIHWCKIWWKRYQGGQPLCGVCGGDGTVHPASTTNAARTQHNALKVQYMYGLTNESMKGVPSRAWLALKGFCNRRIPYIDAPVWAATLILLYVLGNMVAMLHPLNGMDMATNFGYLSGANACLLLIPATRNSLMGLLFGIPFDRHVALHRFLGLFAVFLVVLHTILFWDKWQREAGTSISLTWTNRKYLYGTIGAIGGIMLVLTSLPWVRRNHFNVFFGNHLFWAIIFYTFAMLHTPIKFGPKLAIICILYGLDKLIRAAYATFPMRAVRVEVSTGDLVTIVFPKNAIANTLNLYGVSQYVFVNFPQLNWFEWHPFSLSSAAHEAHCEISIRALGDHTKRLLELARQKRVTNSTLWLRVDGPYGNYGVNHMRYPTKIFFAGGIGVTPIISILRSIYHVGRDGQPTQSGGPGGQSAAEKPISMVIPSVTASCIVESHDVPFHGRMMPLSVPGTVPHRPESTVSDASSSTFQFTDSHSTARSVSQSSITFAETDVDHIPMPKGRRPKRGIPAPPPPKIPRLPSTTEESTTDRFDGREVVFRKRNEPILRAASSRDSHVIRMRMPSNIFDICPSGTVMQDIYVMWAISKEEHFQWFADIFDKISRLEHNFLLPRFHLLVYLSDKTAGPESLQSPIIQGSLRTELKDTLEEIVHRHRDVSTSVYACGPEAMMHDCWDCVSALQRSGLHVHFHKEEFEF
eukprot:m.132971 g.132971  ORF g.132971 m.132971 type:complete len:910 (+) comp9496_c0_seq2:206-2935(+)